MLIYVTFFLHAAVYNNYADEDIPDTVGDLPEADIPDPVPAEEPRRPQPFLLLMRRIAPARARARARV